MIITPEECAKCGGKCCKTPPLFLHEYQRFIDRFGMEAVAEKHPTFTPTGMMMLDDPCLALTWCGCILKPEERPAICQIFPFVAVANQNKTWSILLSVKMCPMWRVYGDHYEEATKIFEHELNRAKTIQND